MEENITVGSLPKKGPVLVKVLALVAFAVILVPSVILYCQRIKEKSVMSDGIEKLVVIAEANRRHHSLHGAYASSADMRLLNVAIKGKLRKDLRLETETFIFSPNGDGSNAFLALAIRIPLQTSYYMYIDRKDGKKVCCSAYKDASFVQKKLCAKLDEEGAL